MPSDEEKFFEHAKKTLFPKIKGVTLSVTILGEPDPKLCMELGAAILFDKPLVVVVPPGRECPANLKRVASAIVEGDMNTPGMMEKVTSAIKSVTDNDSRAKPRT